jgi:anti-anti-sigma factor
MKILLDKTESYTLVALEEARLDAALTPGLKTELVTLNAEGISNLILDLEKVTYADTTGLSALILANNLCKEAGGMLVVCGATGQPSQLLKLSQVDNSLAVVPTRAEAIEHIAFGQIEAELKRALEDGDAL